MGKNHNSKHIVVDFLVIFLLNFMLLIFSPAEIFFTNITEFDFLYGEFAGYMAIIFITILLILTVVISFLPPPNS